MEDIRIYVGAVWPSNRGTLDPHCSKQIEVGFQWFEDRPPELILEVKYTFGIVVEPQPQNKPAERLNFSHANHFGTHAHGNESILARCFVGADKVRVEQDAAALEGTPRPAYASAAQGAVPFRTEVE